MPGSFWFLESYDLYNQAVKYYEAGLFESALPIFKNVLESCAQSWNPFHIAAEKPRYGLALTYFALGQLNKAAQAYEPLLKLSMYRDAAYCDLALIYYSRGHYDQALIQVETVLQNESKDSADDHFAAAACKALILYSKGSQATALRLCDTLIRNASKANKWVAHNHKANLLLASQRYDEAIEYFYIALQYEISLEDLRKFNQTNYRYLSPAVGLHFSKAKLYLQRRSIKNAEKELKLAITKLAASQYIWFSRATLKYLNNKYIKLFTLPKPRIVKQQSSTNPKQVISRPVYSLTNPREQFRLLPDGTLLVAGIGKDLDINLTPNIPYRTLVINNPAASVYLNGRLGNPILTSIQAQSKNLICNAELMLLQNIYIGTSGLLHLTDHSKITVTAHKTVQQPLLVLASVKGNVLVSGEITVVATSREAIPEEKTDQQTKKNIKSVVPDLVILSNKDAVTLSGTITSTNLFTKSNTLFANSGKIVSDKNSSNPGDSYIRIFSNRCVVNTGTVAAENIHYRGLGTFNMPGASLYARNYIASGVINWDFLCLKVINNPQIFAIIDVALAIEIPNISLIYQDIKKIITKIVSGDFSVFLSARKSFNIDNIVWALSCIVSHLLPGMTPTINLIRALYMFWRNRINIHDALLQFYHKQDKELLDYVALLELMLPLVFQTNSTISHVYYHGLGTLDLGIPDWLTLGMDFATLFAPRSLHNSAYQSVNGLAVNVLQINRSMLNIPEASWRFALSISDIGLYQCRNSPTVAGCVTYDVNYLWLEPIYAHTVTINATLVYQQDLLNASTAYLSANDLIQTDHARINVAGLTLRITNMTKDRMEALLYCHDKQNTASKALRLIINFDYVIDKSIEDKDREIALEAPNLQALVPVTAKSVLLHALKKLNIKAPITAIDGNVELKGDSALDILATEETEYSDPDRPQHNRHMQNNSHESKAHLTTETKSEIAQTILAPNGNIYLTSHYGAVNAAAHLLALNIYVHGHGHVNLHGTTKYTNTYIVVDDPAGGYSIKTPFWRSHPKNTPVPIYVAAKQHLAIDSDNDAVDLTGLLIAGTNTEVNAQHGITINISNVNAQEITLHTRYGDILNQASLLKAQVHQKLAADHGHVIATCSEQLTPAVFDGGTGEHHNGVGLEIIAPAGVTNDGSYFIADNDVNINGKQGVTLVGHTRTMHQTRNESAFCGFGERVISDTYTAVLPALIASRNGSTYFDVQEGTLLARGAQFFTKTGTHINAPKGAELQGLPVFKHHSVADDFVGVSVQHTDQSDSGLLPCEIYDDGNSELLAPDGNVNADILAHGHGSLVVKAKNKINLFSDIDHHELHYHGLGLSLDIPLLSLAQRGLNACDQVFPLISDVSALLRSGQAVPLALNSVTTAIDAFIAWQNLQQLRQYPKATMTTGLVSLLSPTVTLSMSHVVAHSESVNTAAIDRAAVSLSAHEVALANAIPVHTNNLQVEADTFRQVGVALHADSATNTTGFSAGISLATGKPNVGISHSESDSHSATYAQQVLTAEQAVIHARNWIQEDATAKIGTLSGHVDRHAAVSHTDEASTNSFSVGASTQGFSASIAQEQHRHANLSGIQAQHAERFSVDHVVSAAEATELPGAQIGSAENLPKPVNHHAAMQVGVQVSRESNPQQQGVIVPVRGEFNTLDMRCRVALPVIHTRPPTPEVALPVPVAHNHRQQSMHQEVVAADHRAHTRTDLPEQKSAHSFSSILLALSPISVAYAEDVDVTPHPGLIPNRQTRFRFKPWHEKYRKPAAEFFYDQSYPIGPIFKKSPYEFIEPEPLFRGTLADVDAVFNHGFIAPGTNTDLLLHATPPNGEYYLQDSGFISTSLSKKVAAKFPFYFNSDIPYTYLYEIHTNKPTINVVEELSDKVGKGLNVEDFATLKLENERAIFKRIEPWEIKGGWKIVIESPPDQEEWDHGVRRLQETFIPNGNYAFDRAAHLWTNARTLGQGLSFIAIGLDIRNLYHEYQNSRISSDYSNTYQAGARIAGGWIGAYTIGSVGAEIGMLSCASLSPYGSAVCGVVGGFAGSIIGYYGGGAASIQLYKQNNSKVQILQNTPPDELISLFSLDTWDSYQDTQSADERQSSMAMPSAVNIMTRKGFGAGFSPVDLSNREISFDNALERNWQSIQRNLYTPSQL